MMTAQRQLVLISAAKLLRMVNGNCTFTNGCLALWSEGLMKAIHNGDEAHVTRVKKCLSTISDETSYPDLRDALFGIIQLLIK
jgi:hypothetical protein